MTSPSIRQPPCSANGLITFTSIISAINSKESYNIIKPSESLKTFEEAESYKYESKEILETQLDNHNEDIKITKDNIYFQMLNAIDYYNYVEGIIVFANGNVIDPINISFQSNLIEGKAYSKVFNNNCNLETYCDNNDNLITVYNNKNKSYSNSFGVVTKKDALAIENSKRITLESDGYKGYNYRSNPTNVALASVCLMPQEVAFGFLEDQSLWEITGTERLLDINCAIIKGKTTDSYGEKLGVNEFVFYVDLNTGVLLKYEGFNKDGILSDFMYVKEISFSDKIKVKSKSNYIEEYSDYNEDKSLAIK